MADPFSLPLQKQQSTPQAAQREKKKPFLRSWKGKAAIGAAAFTLAFSAYSYREQALDQKYEPIERRIDSAYSANSTPVKAEELRGLARLSEKYGMAPGQIVELTRIRRHLESKRDSVALYLSKNRVDEERVLLNLKAHKNLLKEEKSIGAQIELLRNSIAGKQHNEENRQRLLCIIYILEGAREMNDSVRQNLADIL